MRVEELINYFDYGYPAPATRAQPFRPYVAIAPSPWSSQRQLLHIGLQGYALPRTAQPPLNLVFLIDTSGSMSSEDRLPLAKKALGVLIDQLQPQDRVAMVAYAGSAGAVLAPTSGREKLKMRCALGALRLRRLHGRRPRAGAGLCARPAELRPQRGQRVILMTDGDFNVGVADPAKLKDFVADKRKTGVYLSIYGFGRGNYNDALMQTLSQNGNGVAGYVDSLMEARKIFRDDFSSSLFPIADDVKIQVEFNPAKVAEYRLIGYETRLLNREGLQQRPGRRRRGRLGRLGHRPLRDHPRSAPGPPATRCATARDAMRRPRRRAAKLAFLKIRYKLPGQATSRLIERPHRGGRTSARAWPPRPRLPAGPWPWRASARSCGAIRPSRSDSAGAR